MLVFLKLFHLPSCWHEIDGITFHHVGVRSMESLSIMWAWDRWNHFPSCGREIDGIFDSHSTSLPSANRAQGHTTVLHKHTKAEKLVKQNLNFTSEAQPCKKTCESKETNGTIDKTVSSAAHRYIIMIVIYGCDPIWPRSNKGAVLCAAHRYIIMIVIYGCDPIWPRSDKGVGL